MAIEATGITKHFGDFKALDDVSVQVPDGSLTALLGPSGSGKSTLLRVIAGLEEPDTGTVRFGDRDVTSVSAQDRGVGFVFQHYAAFKHMSVRDNIAFGLKIRKQPKEKVKERVDELLGLVHLGGWADRYPAQLSGGQRQRMALARALAVQPRGVLVGAAVREGPAALAAARGAVRRARRDRAQGAARLAAQAARRGPRDDDLRHARP